MKKILPVAFFVLVIFAGISLAFDLTQADQSKINFLAGPSGQNDEFALPWLEVALYPKELPKDGQLYFSVRTTSKVASVSVSFDIDRSISIPLQSVDNMIWEGSYVFSGPVPAGFHMAFLNVYDKNKKVISRTLEFFAGENTSRGAAEKVEPQRGGWQVVAMDDTTLFSERQIYTLPKGGAVEGLYKTPFYKVKFSDGKEGWVKAAAVQEPIDEYCKKGYLEYKSGNYSGAIKNYLTVLEMDSSNKKAWYWLSKSYWKLGDYDNTVASINKVRQLDSRDFSAIVFSNYLAEKFFNSAQDSYRKGNFEQAIFSYNRAIALKPASIAAYLKLADCYSKLGLEDKRAATLKEALRVDPDNDVLRAAFSIPTGTDAQSATVNKAKTASAVAEIKAEEAKITQDKEEELQKPKTVAEWVNVVKNYSTYKGTKVMDAVSNVVGRAKALGTMVKEEGWQIKQTKFGYTITYACQEDRTGKGTNFDKREFSWSVDPQNMIVVADNNNAKLLMSNW